MDAAEHQFPSGDARAGLFAAVGCMVYGSLQLWLDPESRVLSIACLVGAGFWIWRAIRSWHRPYVQLSDERLVVFEHGQPRHYVELAAIASIRSGFNRTVLGMRDGMKISISHLGFLFSDDARRFKDALAERLEGMTQPQRRA